MSISFQSEINLFSRLSLRKFASVIAVVLFAASSFADVAEVDGVKWYYRYNSNIQISGKDSYVYIGAGAEIIEGSEPYAGDLKVPTVLGGYPVKTIGSYAFRNCRGLTSIEIPSSIAQIGYYAFAGCSALRNVIVAEGVGSIGYSAFEACSNLREIKIPSSVYRIYFDAFKGCSRLRSVTILSKDIGIGPNAFAECYNLSDLSLPEGEMSIGDCAFAGCSSLSDRNGFIVVKGVLQDYIGESSSVEIPLGVTRFSDSVFKDRTDISSIVIPEGVTEVGSFSGMTQLTEVKLPQTLTKIGGFSGCSALTEVVLPKNLTEVGGFSGCSALKELVLPKNLRLIKALSKCSSLERIIVEDGNPYYYVENQCLISAQDQYELYSDGSRLVLTRKGELLAAIPKDGVVDVPIGVKIIKRGAFNGDLRLTNITLPKGLQEIDAWAFAGCRKLKKIVIPKEVTSIAAESFEGCSGLVELDVEDGNEKYWCANNCIVTKTGSLCVAATGTGLVDIPQGVTSISSCFNDCDLRQINIPEGVTKIFNSFWNCNNLEDVSFPSSLVSISSSFYKCAKLQEVSFPEGLERLGAFTHCSNLKKVSIPSTVNSLGSFSRCPRLESLSVDSANPDYRSEGNFVIRRLGDELKFGSVACGDIIIPESVESIGSEAFAGASGLTSVILPQGLRNIRDGAFRGCSSLTNVKFQSGINAIEMSAFARCANLTSLHLPESVHSIRGGAFLGCPLSDISIESGSPFTLAQDRTIRDYRGGIVYAPICQAKIVRVAPRENEPAVYDVTYEVRASYPKVDVRVLAFIGGSDWSHAVCPQTFVATADGTPSVIGENVPVNKEVTFSWKMDEDIDDQLASSIQFKILVNPIGIPSASDLNLSYDDAPILMDGLTDGQINDILGWLYAYGDASLSLTDGELKDGAKVLAKGGQVFADNAIDYLKQVMTPWFFSLCRPGVVSALGEASICLPSQGMFLDGVYTNLFSSSYSDGQVTPYVADVSGDGFWDLVVVAGSETNVYVRQPSSDVTCFERRDVDGCSFPQGLWYSNSVDVILAGKTLNPVPANSVSVSSASSNELFFAQQDGSIWHYKDSILETRGWGGTSSGFAENLMISMVDWDSDGDIDCVYGAADGRLGLLLNPQPLVPRGLAAEIGIDSVRLAWKPDMQPRNYGYRICRIDGKGELISFKTSQPSLVDMNLQQGGDYSYAVSSFSRYYIPGNSRPIIQESELSDFLCVTLGTVRFFWNDVVCKLGENANVMLSIENSMNYDVAGKTQVVTYDPEYLRPLKVASTGLTEGIGFTESFADGKWMISMTSGTLPAGGGKFFTLVFETLKEGTTTVGGATVMIAASSENAPYQLGDVNGDGKLDQEDVRELARLKNGNGRKHTANQLKAGDFNGNGKLDNADYQALRELLKEKGVL